MRSARTVFCILAALAGAGQGLADGTVTLDLASTMNGLTVAPGATIDWTISFTVSNDPPGQNQGLALIAVNLLQDGANPAKLDIPPADGVPTAMANFSRPEGISNPGEGGAGTGYIGVQRGTPGEMNLIQIGGAQNTFGAPGDIMGTNPNLVGGVGHGGAVTLTQGTFAAPAAQGSYIFRIDEALANVLEELNTPPEYSPVSAATVTYGAQSFCFTVGAGQLGDLNCDGAVNAFDIDPFVLALTDPAGYAAAWPNCDIMLADCNGDGAVNAFDIDPFVLLLIGP